MPRKSKGSSWEKKGARIGGSIGAIANKVQNIISELNVEKKLLDTNISGTATTTGTVIPLQSMATGSTQATREGNSIKATSLYLPFNCTIGASNSIVRCMLVQDNQQVADTSPVLSDILQTVDVYSPLNSASLGRYKVLMDDTYRLDTVANPLINVKRKYFKLQHHIRYNGALSTDVQKGGMYFIYLSTLASGAPTVAGYSRLRWVDN